MKLTTFLPESHILPRVYTASRDPWRTTRLSLTPAPRLLPVSITDERMAASDGKSLRDSMYAEAMAEAQRDLSRVLTIPEEPTSGSMRDLGPQELGEAILSGARPS